MIESVKMNGNKKWKSEFNKNKKLSRYIIIVFKKGRYEFALIPNKPGLIEEDAVWLNTGSDPGFNPKRYEIKNIELVYFVDGEEFVTILNRQRVALDDLDREVEGTCERIRINKSLHILLR